MKDVVIRHAYNLEYYEPRLWERIALWFCRLETHEHDGVLIQYKTFGNRMYIITLRRVTYSFDGGVNSPWMN